MLQIFDENKKPLGLADRKDVHSKGLFHEAVHVLLFNSKGEMFLGLRAKDKDINPGKWSTFGEHKKPGESDEAAMRRGLKEELGITEKIPLEFVGEFLMKNPKDRQFSLIYKAVFDGKVMFADNEMEEGRFFPVSEVGRMVAEERDKCSPNFLQVWEFFLQKTGGKGDKQHD